jgi:eukaryotic-like serine/threonine-protein kinase
VTTLPRDPTHAERAAAPVASSKPFLSPGILLGRYRIERPLGNGSMGEVYLARDDQLGRRAAIKVLGGKHHNNPTVRERFVREARALAALSHPNVIPVFESGQVGSPPRPYYAMELLEGGDTHKLLDERGPLPSSVVAVIGAQAATGLGEAARAQLIHRDVKPSNLGISRQGVLKVTDFGLAKMSTGDAKLTGKGLVVGTADYIAPEQARGEEVDERADVYALGCTLFHLLTGHPPFQSRQSTPAQQFVEVMRAHVESPIPDPRQEVPDADPELAQVIMMLMTKERERRPAFSEAAPLLSRIALRLGGELPRVSRQIFTVPFGTPIVAGPRTEPSRQPTQRWRTLAALAALLLSAVALLLSLWHQR